MSPILNYEEITPCLRDVTKEWEDMIDDSNRPYMQFNQQTLLKCVQQGQFCVSSFHTRQRYIHLILTTKLTVSIEKAKLLLIPEIVL